MPVLYQCCSDGAYFLRVVAIKIMFSMQLMSSIGIQIVADLISKHDQIFYPFEKFN